MLKSFVAVVLFFGFLVSAYGQKQPQQLVDEKPLKVLFIGNSYTYFNNLPQILEKMVAEKDSRGLETKMIVEGGATLQDVWEKKDTLKAIHQQKWDYVILQEQSKLGNTYIVNGNGKIVDPQNFHRYARLFDEEINKIGAKTVFYLTWAGEDTEPREQQILNNAYMSIGRELKDLVSPVGIVWQQVRKRDPRIKLYIEDKSHPTPIGSYIAACVLYSSLLGKSPIGLPNKITGRPVDDDGNIDTTKNLLLVNITKKDAELIQKTAWQTYQKLKSSGGYFPASKPPLPKLPTLLTGRMPSTHEIEGIWIGKLNFYPVPWAATMKLTIRREGEDWRTDLKISFESHPDAEKNPPVTNFKLTKNGISFLDSKGIGGTPISYNAAFNGKSLDGIAEFTSKDQYAIGTWKLTRQKQ